MATRSQLPPMTRRASKGSWLRTLALDGRLRSAQIPETRTTIHLLVVMSETAHLNPYRRSPFTPARTTHTPLFCFVMFFCPSTRGSQTPKTEHKEQNKSVAHTSGNTLQLARERERETCQLHYLEGPQSAGAQNRGGWSTWRVFGETTHPHQRDCASRDAPTRWTPLSTLLLSPPLSRWCLSCGLAVPTLSSSRLGRQVFTKLVECTPT